MFCLFCSLYYKHEQHLSVFFPIIGTSFSFHCVSIMYTICDIVQVFVRIMYKMYVVKCTCILCFKTHLNYFPRMEYDWLAIKEVGNHNDPVAYTRNFRAIFFNQNCKKCRYIPKSVYNEFRFISGLIKYCTEFIKSKMWMYRWRSIV